MDKLLAHYSLYDTRADTANWATYNSEQYLSSGCTSCPSAQGGMLSTMPWYVTGALIAGAVYLVMKLK